MGYLSSGYAFSVEPDWERVRRLLPAFHVRGYKHGDRPLWMLDAWKTIAGVQEHYPFTGEPIEFKDLEIEDTKPDPPLATTFERICDLVEASGEYVSYERAFLRVPLAVAAAAQAQTFAFTADDDTLDFAALVDAGSYVRLGCRMESLDMVLDDGVLRVMPLTSDEDDDDGPMSKLLRGLARIENVRLGEPTTVNDGRRIYYHPSTVWPEEWGNAEELLGFGTFDPFETFAEQFEPVFEANLPKDRGHTPRVEQAAPSPTPTRDLGMLAAIAACVLWPVGIGLVIYHAARNEGRKLAQAGILCGAGLVLMLGGIAPIQIGLGAAASREYEDLIYAGFAVIAAAVAIGLRSWLVRRL
jgi:hypothetical protein